MAIAKPAKKTTKAAAVSEGTTVQQVSRKSVIRFGFKERTRIFEQIKADYTSSGMSDVDYAVYAAQKLGIAKMNACHIGELRREFDIPANRGAGARPSGDAAVIAALEARIQSMETFLAKQGYIPLPV